MSSSLEIVLIHLPDDVAPDLEQSKEFIDEWKYVRSQKGNKGVKWGRAVGQNVSVVFCEWESLDDYHNWQKEPRYNEFQNYWMNFARKPSPGTPPLEIRHIHIPTAKLEHVLSKKYAEVSIEGEHHGLHGDHEHQGKPHFVGKVVEGFGEGKSITLTGLENSQEGRKALESGHEAVYKVALSHSA